MVFSDWQKSFHIHVDVMSRVIGIMLSQLGEGELDHPMNFAIRKLSIVEKNYTTTEREELAMVYALQKFRHYLLGYHFKMYTYHSALRLIVNKPMLGGGQGEYANGFFFF